ncbi:MAG: hypothetical protein KatS3mg111_2250 [Pirellulaceae bacterium]|nr:MAG: hypothetical protein KatS3mg111_2250 [Pirellulaceae bacterium]
MSDTTQATEAMKEQTTSPERSTNGEATRHDRQLPPETFRTIIYAVVAVACIGITIAVELMTRPAEIAEYGKVGQEFYPDFVDPTEATSLTVRTIDKDAARPVEFSVRRNEEGQWVIPSHHNYPADAEERLARTAASVIGIKRGALVTRWASDHARFGVVDPARDTLNVDELEGVGTRLVLRGKDDSVLFDLIIGKKVEGEEGDENQFYVRHPDEDEVYIAALDIDLSTRFRDWIDTDLLAIDAFDTRLLEIRDYQFDELRGTVTQTEISRLTRTSSTDPWKLEGLDETKYEVDQQKVRETVNTLANLEIVGVRPKLPGLTADLRLDRSAIKSQGDVDRLQSDLLARGFLLQPGNDGDPNSLKLLAREGEMTVATEDAVAYDLYFGRAFTGTEEELELGFTTTKASSTKATAGQQSGASAADQKADAADSQDRDSAGESGSNEEDDRENDDAGPQPGQSDEATDESDEQSEAEKKPGRYVFIRARIDTSVLGAAPEEPVEPQMPEALKKAEEEAKQQEAGAEQESDDTADANSGDSEVGNPSADDSDSSDSDNASDEQNEELEKLRQEYEQAKSAYEEAKRKYDEYHDKLKKAQEKVDELNRRFAKWYYVIPGEDYEKLTLHRSDLIKEKSAEEDSSNEQSGDSLSLPELPSGTGSMPADAEAESAAADSSPASGSSGETAGGDAPVEEPPAPEPPRPAEVSDEPPAPTTAPDGPSPSKDPTNDGLPATEEQPPAPQEAASGSESAAAVNENGGRSAGQAEPE